MDYVVVPLSGSPDEKVVDIAIQRTLQAVAAREADVLLVSHDGDFLEDLSALIADHRRVGIAAFSEFRNAGFSTLAGLRSSTSNTTRGSSTHRCRAFASFRSTSSTRARSSAEPARWCPGRHRRIMPL
jgi:hypothetical protein